LVRQSKDILIEDDEIARIPDFDRSGLTLPPQEARAARGITNTDSSRKVFCGRLSRLQTSRSTISSGWMCESMMRAFVTTKSAGP
jgi:hypothetical protein